MSSFVLGFADEAAQIAGLAWLLDGPGGRSTTGALVARDGEDSGAGGTASLDGNAVTAETSLGERKVSVAFDTGGGHDLKGEAPGSPVAVLGDASVTIEGEGETRCRAQLTRWDGEPAAGATLLRHLWIPARDGASVVLVAVRPDGAANHAEELVASWNIDSGGATGYVDSLLSTQYDGDGQPTRAGLELWPEDPDGRAFRAAGSNLIVASPSDGATAALMHTSAEGFSAVGTYLLVRA